jgi:predicted nucleic acid-binding protein
MSLYADTSVLLKLLWEEPETERVEELVLAEPEVIVSDVARLELTVQIGARRAGGHLTPRGAVRLLQRAELLLATPPLRLRATAPSLLESARQAVDVSDEIGHCRTLDRLHLAAMTGLGLDRLLTNDDAQARAARRAGHTVLMPR